jgi:DNA-binding transcriptional LysR family regulator
VVAQSDLLTVLPERFLVATGNADGLVTRDLPMPVGTVQVEMVWHLRHDTDPAHRWLREQVRAAAAA